MKVGFIQQRAEREERGSILVTVLFVASVLALLVAAVASDSMQTLRTVSQSGKDTQAKFGAYAGMEIVMNELRKEPDYIGSKKLGDRHGSYGSKLEDLADIEFEVLIWNNVMLDGEPKPEPLEGPGGVKVQADTVYMVASGKDVTSGQEVILASMAGTARRIRPVFSDAAYARSKMVIDGGSKVDAWDSNGGHTPYREKSDSPGSQESTIEDYAATLGTDGIASQTLRLLGTSELNGHFRVGPNAGGSGEVFGTDNGSNGGGVSPFEGGLDEGGSPVKSSSGPVATASVPTNVKGTDEEGKTKAVVDEEATETPRFNSPFTEADIQGSVTLDKEWGENVKGEPTRPPATDLSPGGYKSVNVPKDQTLVLSPGVYYFEDTLEVRGRLETSGHGPVIVFCGKQAIFDGAEVNKDGSTARFQLCFTDELKDEALINSIATTLSSQINDVSQEQLLAMLANKSFNFDQETGLPVAGAQPAAGGSSGTGMSYLSMSNSTFFGSVSGSNLAARISGSNVYGSMMGNVIVGKDTDLHQDLSLKGSSLMQASGWALQGVHQVR